MTAPLAAGRRAATLRVVGDGARAPSRGEILRPEILPSAPGLLPQLLALSHDDADVGELVALLERDPGLTARILRTANSPFFGQGRSVASVQRAVVVLGLAMVRNLALGLVVWDASSSQIPIDRVASLWEHSLAVALVAQELAARAGVSDPTDGFTVGLLHDAGRLVLARRFPDLYLPLLSSVDGERAIAELERTTLACDHAQVGGWLFDAWRVPQPLVDAIARHHDEQPTPGLAGLVSTASALVHHAAAGAGAHEDDAETLLERAAAAGIAPALFLEIAERRRRDTLML